MLIDDGYYHAIEKNTPKNGVLTALEDFSCENSDIDVMNLKLSNEILILYLSNNISENKLGKLYEDMKNHVIGFDKLQDNLFKNQQIFKYISNSDLSKPDLLDMSDRGFDFKTEKIIKEYGEKLILKRKN